MTHQTNATASGEPFDENTVEAVWMKATRDHRYTIFAFDSCGASIQRTKYGTKDLFGWEIDHIKPVSQGGTDDLDNLQPLHWENNLVKADYWPEWKCFKGK